MLPGEMMCAKHEADVILLHSVFTNSWESWAEKCPLTPEHKTPVRREPTVCFRWLPFDQATTNSALMSGCTSGFQTASSVSMSSELSLDRLLSLWRRAALRSAGHRYGPRGSLLALRRRRRCRSNSWSCSTLQRVALFSVCRKRSPKTRHRNSG